MQEDVDELLKGQDISEEFKQKAQTLFEAAVSARVNLEAVKIQEEYDAKLEEQGNRCAICGTDDSGPMAFHADHDHKTGKKRGVLCHKCNTGLGLLKDDVEVLCAAIEYLNHYTK